METKKTGRYQKIMQMPEEAIASLNESEADRLRRLAVMFYKETGDGVYKGESRTDPCSAGRIAGGYLCHAFFYGI